MATYVNDLRLKEIATGDESGTWGTSTNTNLELIAEAFSFGTEAITTNADTHTTTIADGSTDPGRSIFLKYTGTLDSACTITIGPNTVSKLWLIENATSGSQTIIIKQGSGATITVPNGQTKAIYSDGAGSGGAMVDAFQDLSIPDLFIDDDLTFTSDSAVITFGADGDTTLTHTDGSGLTLNSTNKIMFNDASQFIQGSSATVLSLGATDEIDLTATLIDINGNADVSGTVTATGTSVFASLDISGDIDVDGTTNLDVVDIDGAVDMASTLQVDGAITSSAGATITVADNSDVLTLISTDADANQGPILNLFRNSGSPADSDVLAQVLFSGENDADEEIEYSRFQGFIVDASDGTEDGGLNLQGMLAGTLRSRLKTNATELVINDDSQDLDFRVESSGNANMLFVDAGNDHVNIGTSSDLGGVLNVGGSIFATTTAAGTAVKVESSQAGSGAGPGLVLYRNSSSPADSDLLGNLTFEAKNDAGQDVNYANLFAQIADASDGTEDGILNFRTILAGTEVRRIDLGSSETVFNEDSKDLDFRVESDAQTHGFFLDASTNNAGFSVTPITGNLASFNSVQFGQSGIIQTAPATSFISVNDNVYRASSGSTGYKAINTGASSLITQSSGQMDFYTNASASAGADVTLSSRMTIALDGSTTFAGNVKVSDILASGSGGLSFQTDEGTKRIIIEDSGHVILGDGSLSTAIDTNGVVSAGDAAYSFSIKNTITSGDPFGILIQYTGMNPNDAGHEFITCFAQSTLKHEVRSNGGIANFQSNDANLCDEREKKNIEATASQWALVKGFDIKQFHYNDEADSDTKRLGVIAQEVETYAPELITDWQKTKQHDEVLWEAGEDLPDGVSVGDVKEAAVEEVLRKGVKEQQMMWMAIKALQEAQTRIETLEAEVAALKGE